MEVDFDQVVGFHQHETWPFYFKFLKGNRDFSLHHKTFFLLFGCSLELDLLGNTMESKVATDCQFFILC